MPSDVFFQDDDLTRDPGFEQLSDAKAESIRAWERHVEAPAAHQLVSADNLTFAGLVRTKHPRGPSSPFHDTAPRDAAAAAVAASSQSQHRPQPFGTDAARSAKRVRTDGPRPAVPAGSPSALLHRGGGDIALEMRCDRDRLAAERRDASGAAGYFAAAPRGDPRAAFLSMDAQAPSARRRGGGGGGGGGCSPSLTHQAASSRTPVSAYDSTDFFQPLRSSPRPCLSDAAGFSPSSSSPFFTEPSGCTF